MNESSLVPASKYHKAKAVCCMYYTNNTYNKRTVCV